MTKLLLLMLSASVCVTALTAQNRLRIDDPWRLFVRTGEVWGISADGTRADSATVLLTYGDSTETRTYRDVSLWSPEHPVLYTLQWGDLTVEHGFRTLSYSAADGLRLNGRPYVLNGGCLHHDNGVIGAAAFDAAEWHKARLMKEAGFNAAHLAASKTPADPSVNSTTCHAWQGRAVCAVRSGHKAGTLRLTVSGPGLRTQTLSLRVR